MGEEDENGGDVEETMDISRLFDLLRKRENEIAELQEQANNAVQLRTAVIERNQDLSQLHAVLQDRNKDIVQLQQWGKEQADEIDQLRELLRQLSHEAPIMGVTKSSETEA